MAGVEIDSDAEAYGGKVHNGVWVIWLPTTDSPMNRPWRFVRGDGSIAVAALATVYRLRREAGAIDVRRYRYYRTW